MSTDSSVNPAAAAPAAAAAENGSSNGTAASAAADQAQEGLQQSLEYLRYSIEAGVASGFQLASAAGPLCDEPLWGVAVAVEARLNLGGGGAGGGAAASLQLAEDVYGPFSGQVTGWLGHNQATTACHSS
jgi:ribosome assembly protein 1